MNCSYQAAINRNTLAKHKISARVIYITYKRNQFFLLAPLNPKRNQRTHMKAFYY